MLKLKKPYDLVLLLTISVVIRAFLAFKLELGNDEVYYWLYAKYPDWSHFDHPPMVGFIIQIFNLNLFFDSEFALRLGAIILGTTNLWLAFKIGCIIKDRQLGIISSLLFFSSFYVSIISGMMILPDTPLTFFWLCSLYFLLKIIKDPDSIYNWFIIGICIALAILSKYSAIYLWGGIFIFFTVFRQKLSLKGFVLMNICAIIGLIPILVWNIQNDWVSFGFHSTRVGGDSISLLYFLREVGGELIYHNLIIYFLIYLGLVKAFKGKLNFPKEYRSAILFISIPLVLSIWIASLFKPTLPHWNGPAFLGLLFFAAFYLYDLRDKVRKTLMLSIACIMLLGLGAGYYQIFYGKPVVLENTSTKTLGRGDVSLDMYGWKQLKTSFVEVLDTYNNTKHILCDNWFPAAHLDYYLADPLGLELIVYGGLDKIHKYKWINSERRQINSGENAFYITFTNEYRSPEPFNDLFEEVEPLETIPIVRNDRIVKFAHIYHLKNLRK